VQICYNSHIGGQWSEKSARRKEGEEAHRIGVLFLGPRQLQGTDITEETTGLIGKRDSLLPGGLRKKISGERGKKRWRNIQPEGTKKGRNQGKFKQTCSSLDWKGFMKGENRGRETRKKERCRPFQCSNWGPSMMGGGGGAVMYAPKGKGGDAVKSHRRKPRMAIFYLKGDLSKYEGGGKKGNVGVGAGFGGIPSDPLREKWSLLGTTTEEEKFNCHKNAILVNPPGRKMGERWNRGKGDQWGGGKTHPGETPAL